jgi:serine/threonine protein kinase
MSVSESEFDPVGQLADDFVSRLRRGERPSIEEYADRHPEYSAKIRAVFSVLHIVENLKPPAIVGAGFPKFPAEQPDSFRQTPAVVGDYTIVREIGRGGMGVVYEAEHQSLQRRVALKILRPGDIHDLRARERFRREAQTAARLHHTNIVPVYEVGESDDLFYYAMQYIDGRGIDRILDQLNPLGDDQTTALLKSQPSEPPSSAARTSGIEYWRAVARIGIQAAEALQYAHERNVLHRDIKPSNLLLDTNGTLWITDFGLATAAVPPVAGANELTQTGDIVGTIRYMAPERLQGRGDRRSDVYGLGITLYELLTRRRAFSGPDQVNLLQQVARIEPPRPRSIDRQIPRDLETIVLKACQKEPGRRYQAAVELADDLRRFLEMRPILARDTTRLERGWWWCRRNPAVAISLVSIAGLLTLLAAGATAAALYLSATLERSEAHRQLAERANHAANYHQQIARTAEAERTNQLWLSLRDQAIAGVWSGRPGQSRHGLDTIRQAAAIRPSLPLRNTAVTCMTLPDLTESEWTWFASPGNSQRSWQAIVVGTDGLDARMSGPQTLTISDCKTGRELGRLTGCLNPNRLSFSPDGIYVVLADVPALNQPVDGSVEIWDWRRGQRILITVDNVDCGLAFNPDGTECVVGRTSGDLVFFELPRGLERRRTRLEVAALPRLCLYTPDGEHVLTCLQTRSKIETIVVATGEPAGRDLEVPARISAMAISPDGHFFAIGGANWRTYIWDFETSSFVREFVGHQAEISWVGFESATAQLVTASWDMTKFSGAPSGCASRIPHFVRTHADQRPRARGLPSAGPSAPVLGARRSSDLGLDLGVIPGAALDKRRIGGIYTRWRWRSRGRQNGSHFLAGGARQRQCDHIHWPTRVDGRRIRRTARRDDARRSSTGRDRRDPQHRRTVRRPVVAAVARIDRSDSCRCGRTESRRTLVRGGLLARSRLGRLGCRYRKSRPQDRSRRSAKIYVRSVRQLARRHRQESGTGLFVPATRNSSRAPRASRGRLRVSVLQSGRSDFGADAPWISDPITRRQHFGRVSDAGTDAIAAHWPPHFQSRWHAPGGDFWCKRRHSLGLAARAREAGSNEARLGSSSLRFRRASNRRLPAIRCRARQTRELMCAEAITGRPFRGGTRNRFFDSRGFFVREIFSRFFSE